MNNNIKGLILIVVGMLFIITQDVLIKYTIHDASLMQILVFRGGVGFSLLCLYLIYTKQTIFFGTAHPYIAIFRGSTFFFGFTLFFISLSQITLAEATSLFFVSPFFMTIFSYFILKEKINVATWFAIAVSFCGVILIMRPGLTIFNPYLIIPLCAAFFYSLFQIATRLNAKYDDNETMLFYNGLIGAIITFVLSLFFWQPLHSFSFIFFIFLGIFFCTGLFLQIKALSITPASILAPYNYTIIVWGIIFGLLVYGEIPDIFTIIGAIIIVSSGIFIFRYSYK